MADPFENDEWVEISDDNGHKTALRHLATIMKTTMAVSAVH